MKKILLTISAVLLLLIFVSCNMDSSTGLFQEAGESVKKESYVIRKVLDEVTDTNTNNKIVLVASDEGFFTYNATTRTKLSSTVGTGVKANNVVWGGFDTTGPDASWSCIYYNVDEGKYYKVNQDGKESAADAIFEEYRFFNSTYDTDGKTYGVYTKNDEYYVSLTDSDVTQTKFLKAEFTPDSNTLTCKDVLYLGDGCFMGKSGSTYYTFKYDGASITDGKKAESYFTSYRDGTFVTMGGKIINGSTTLATVSGTFYAQMIRSITLSDKTYFVFYDVGDVYIVDTSSGTASLSSKTCSSLSSLEVVYISEVKDGKYINVITSESGSKCINLETQSIDSSWK